MQEDLELAGVDQVGAHSNLLEEAIQNKHTHLIRGLGLAAHCLLLGQRWHVETWELEDETGSQHVEVSDPSQNVESLLGLGLSANQTVLEVIASLDALSHVVAGRELILLVLGGDFELSYALRVIVRIQTPSAHLA